MSGNDLVTVPLSTPGRLTPSAAASYERLKTQTQTTGTTQANHAYRDYQAQVDLWNAYMTTNWAASDKNVKNTRNWNGKVWYRKPGKPSVAIPGQSNHGDGDTVDFQGLGGYGSQSFQKFAISAARHGWNNVEGRSINEPWHWSYVLVNDQYRNTPIPPNTEDDMSAEDTQRLINIEGAVHRLEVAWGSTPRPDGNGRDYTSDLNLDRTTETLVLVQGLASHQGVDVDEAALAAALLPQLVAALSANIGTLTDATLAEIAKAVADEDHRRTAG